MGFYVNRTKAGNTLLVEGGGGTLNVLSGKARPTSWVAKKDEGSIKKGDTINGIEFVLKLADSENFTPQIYEQGKDGAYGKYIPDPQPLVFPLDGTLKVSGETGESYLALFAHAAELGLSEGIMDGFKADLNIGENKFTKQLIKGDFKNASSILSMQFDNAEKITCAIDFPVAANGNYGGGAKSQTEAEKLAERITFVTAVLTDASKEQQLFVSLCKAEDLTLVGFISLMFS